MVDVNGPGGAGGSPREGEGGESAAAVPQAPCAASPEQFWWLAVT
ncbi:hypothetical protein ACFQ8C_07900 [Streptomyces sp. NPDC056503]